MIDGIAVFGMKVLVPDAGHFPQVEQPGVFFTAVREFLK